MKRKVSFLINMIVICLCVCTIVIGVYSATSSKLNMSGTIGFVAHQCELDVEISKQGYAFENDLTQYYKLPQTIDLNPNDDSTKVGRLGGKQPTITSLVNLGTLNFTDLAEKEIPSIIIKIKAINKSPYKVTGFVTVDKINNVNYARQYSIGNSEVLNAHSAAVVMDKEDSITFAITLNVDNIDLSIDPTQLLNIKCDFAKYNKESLQAELKTIEDASSKLIYTATANDSAAYYTVTSSSKDTKNLEIAPIINNLPVTHIAANAFSGNTTLTTFNIPSTVTSIGDEAFYGCSNLTGTLTIPNGVTKIGIRVFSGCKSLTGTLTLPNGTTSIGYGAFTECSGFAGDLVIPDGVTSIGYGAFARCGGFTSLTLPESVTYIDSEAFKSCSGLTGKLVLPSKLKNIPTEAFKGCNNIETILFPNGLNSIGVGAFSLCSGITGDLIIPENVTNIGYGVFYECRNLTSITFKSKTPPTINGAMFEYCYSLANIYVPDESIEDYSTATNLSAYASKIKPVSEKC